MRRGPIGGGAAGGAARGDNHAPMSLKITFPEQLPVSSRRDEIMEAMDKHQVIIVCGETGSGKTTQLPKIALARPPRMGTHLRCGAG